MSTSTRLPLFTKSSAAPSWPKPVAQLTDEQRRIKDEWLRSFHERLSYEHPHIVRFNHGYAARSARPGRTLEIGAGLGEHLRYEDLAAQEYHAVELLESMAEAIRRDFPSAVTVVADCQQSLPYGDAGFDRAIAIHVLEHLPNLPVALDEIERLLKPGGVFSVVIPCEGGVGYGIGRRLTYRRAFERRYKTSYDWLIESEHVNRPREIVRELRRRFDVADVTYFPSRIPLVDLNLLIGITCVRRAGE
ncbi:MAG TPA: methyltransferase domain-containing protein [Solirubrobacteraceae bacterium]|nr:methyltransferase domain-containing protein [Solirubrobacteraceae bacterium]